MNCPPTCRALTHEGFLRLHPLFQDNNKAAQQSAATTPHPPATAFHPTPPATSPRVAGTPPVTTTDDDRQQARLATPPRERNTEPHASAVATPERMAVPATVLPTQATNATTPQQAGAPVIAPALTFHPREAATMPGVASPLPPAVVSNTTHPPRPRSAAATSGGSPDTCTAASVVGPTITIVDDDFDEGSATAADGESNGSAVEVTAGDAVPATGDGRVARPTTVVIDEGEGSGGEAGEGGGRESGIPGGRRRRRSGRRGGAAGSSQGHANGAATTELPPGDDEMAISQPNAHKRRAAAAVTVVPPSQDTTEATPTQGMAAGAAGSSVRGRQGAARGRKRRTSPASSSQALPENGSRRERPRPDSNQS